MGCGHRLRRKRPRFFLHAAAIDVFEPLEARRLLAAHIVGGGTYSTIQAAVDAASSGATITVDPGAYSEQVVIGTSVTLEGAMAGVDGRSNARESEDGETVCTGITLADGDVTYAFKVAANDVTIDGFTVQNESDPNVSTGAGIVIAPNVSGTHIINNIIQNNCTGLYLANASASDAALIQHNKFLDNNNGAAQTNNGGRGIYTDSAISGGLLQNVTIDGNFFFGNLGPNDFQYQPAIGLESYTADSQTNINITNNVFAKNGKAVLSINVSNMLIDGNVVENHYDTASAALRFEGGDSNVTITHNNLYADGAPAIRIDEKAVPNGNSNFIIQYNNLYRNGLNANDYRAGLVTNTLQYQGTLTATNNYWGAADGPSGLGSGSGDAILNEGNDVVYQPYASSYIIEPQIPWYGTPQTVTSPIGAEDFDHGPEGISYHDITPGNSGGSYRAHSHADISTTNDGGGGYIVTSTQAGEWLKYTVNVATSGTYLGQFRLANSASGGVFHVELDGTDVSGPITVPNTGGNSTWKTIDQPGINLTIGQHILTIAFDGNSSNGTVGNLNWFDFLLAVGGAPSAPGNVVATTTTPTSAQLTWQDNSDNEAVFAIERMTGSSGIWQPITTTASNVTSYTDTTLLPGITYTYQVRAINGDGDSANALSNAIALPATNLVYLSDLTWISATNGYGPVERDMSVGGQNAGDGGVITINGITYAKGLGAHAVSDVIYNLNGQYSLFQSDVGADDETGATAGLDFQIYGDGMLLWDSGGMSQDDPARSFSLEVTGVQQLRLHLDDLDGNYSGDHGDWAGARLTLAQIPAAPTGLTATPVSGTEIDLSWTDVFGDAGYTIQRSTDNVNFTQIGTTVGNVTTFPDTTVSEATTYDYRVIATNAAGDSPPSNTTSAQPMEKPAAPTGLMAHPLTSNQVIVSWTGVTGEADYNIERSTDNVNFAQIGTAAANATSYSDTTVVGSRQYYYRISATNGAGDSPYSNIASAVTSTGPSIPAAPIGLAATAASSSQINLTWTDNSTNEIGFKIERSPDGTSWTLLGSVARGITTYSDSEGLATATTYDYRVLATNYVGDSAPSNVASAATQSSPVTNTQSDIAAGSVWKYLDDGSNQGTAWESTTFDDSSWKSGAGPLGYGDGAEVTVVSYGPSPASKYITTYFRKSFSVTNASMITALTLKLMRNDGAVVYLNGMEIYRSNMPAGTIGYTTLASSIIGPSDKTAWYLVNVNPALLVNGTNVLAVEIHQVSASSGDIGFDAQLIATAVSPTGLPAPWADGDVGSPSPAGSASYSGGIYTVKGAGTDIWSTADSFNYVYQRWTGDGQIIARVPTIQNTNGWAKAGVMFRDSLAAGAATAAMVITPTNGSVFVYRTTTNGSADADFDSAPAAPYWVKIIRSGSSFSGYESSDGAAWTLVGTVTISMTNPTIYMGLAVCSKAAATLNTATFDNVATSTSTSMALAAQAQTQTIVPMQVSDPLAPLDPIVITAPGNSSFGRTNRNRRSTSSWRDWLRNWRSR